MTRLMKGIVIKTEGRWMWVATEDRRFVRFPLPSYEVRPGQEILVTSSQSVAAGPPYRWPLVAGFLVLLLFGAILARVLSHGDPVAYLALDINPSLELAVNSVGRVTDILPLNQDARSLLQGLSLEGRDVYETLNEIVQKSAKEGYISADRENLVLLTIIPGRTKDNPLDASRIKEVVLSRMAQTGVRGRVGIQIASLEERKEARQEGISINSYLITKKASLMGYSSILPLQSAIGVQDIIDRLASEGVSLEQLVDDAGVTYPGTYNDDRTKAMPQEKTADLEPGPVSEVDLTGNEIPKNRFPAGSKRGSSKGGVSDQMPGPLSGLYEPEPNARNGQPLSPPLSPPQETNAGLTRDSNVRDEVEGKEKENEAEIVPVREEDKNRNVDEPDGNGGIAETAGEEDKEEQETGGGTTPGEYNSDTGTETGETMDRDGDDTHDEDADQ